MRTLRADFVDAAVDGPSEIKLPPGGSGRPVGLHMAPPPEEPSLSRVAHCRSKLDALVALEKLLIRARPLLTVADASSHQRCGGT